MRLLAGFILGLSTASAAIAQPPRPHAQLETPLVSNANWPWYFAKDIEDGFPYRGDGGHPELLRGTYVSFWSEDQKYARGINFHAEYEARAKSGVTP